MSEEALRPVRAIAAPGLTPAPVGLPPRMDVLPLSAMVIDDSYQRGLSLRSIALIKRIVQGWDWAQVKALSVMERPDGRFEIIDGQHTAIAAATHGGIEVLPCLVMPNAELGAKAMAFVGLNANRVALTAANLFFASAAGGNAEVQAALAGARKAGATILRRLPTDGKYAVGSVAAVGAIQAVARNKGAPGVARLLSIGVKAGLAPIPAALIRALSILLWDREYAGEASDGDIETVLRSTPWAKLEKRAAEQAAASRQPRAKALAGTIFRSLP